MKKVIKIKSLDKKAYKKIKQLLKANHIKFKKDKHTKLVWFKYNRKFDDIVKIVESMNCKVKFKSYVHKSETSDWCKDSDIETQLALRYFRDKLDDMDLSEDEFNKVDGYLKMVV